MKETRNIKMNIAKLIDVGTRTTVEGKASDYEEETEVYLQAWDDVSGEELNPTEVKKARDKEMQYIEEKGVWRVVSRQDAVRRGVKIVQDAPELPKPPCRKRIPGRRSRRVVCINPTIRGIEIAH